jgi:hypothetical protein
MGRFFDVLNTPSAVLGVLVVTVGVNVFLYLGYSSEMSTPPPAERSGHQTRDTTTIERMERAGAKERTPPQSTQPATTLQSTTPTRPSVTADASASASATASATSSP